MGLVAVAGSTTDRRSRLVETNVLNDGDSQLSSSFFSPPLRIDRSVLPRFRYYFTTGQFRFDRVTIKLNLSVTPVDLFSLCCKGLNQKAIRSAVRAAVQIEW